MAVRSMTIEEKVWYQGMSSASGYRTRLFSHPGDARTEEAWLNKQWSDARAYWAARVSVDDEELDARATHILEIIAPDACVGMHSVSLEPSQHSGECTLCVCQSNNDIDENNTFIAYDETLHPEKIWFGSVRNDVELAVRVSNLTWAWQSQPAP